MMANTNSGSWQMQRHFRLRYSGFTENVDAVKRVGVIGRAQVWE